MAVGLGELQEVQNKTTEGKFPQLDLFPGGHSTTTQRYTLERPTGFSKLSFPGPEDGFQFFVVL